MDTRTEPIRQDIDNLRESMTDKMGQIEAKIKGTVDDTTETLKRGLDVKYQVSEHPWTALGVAVLAGYALGSMGSNDSKPSTYRYSNDSRHQDIHRGDTVRYYGESEQRNQDWGKSENTNTAANFSQARNENAYRNDDDRNRQQSSSGGFVDDVMGQLGMELDTLKTAAISSLVNLLRDTVKQNLPGVYDEAERLRGGSASSNGGSSSNGFNAINKPSYSNSSAFSTGSGSANPSSSASNSGEGEFYREADITEGRTNRYERTPDMYPAGSSESDKTPSTQREVGSNPNYDMVPPAPHANPDGRP